MSYRYNGRYTHSYEEYQRWKREGDAEELRQTNSALRSQADSLQSDLQSTRDALRQSHNDVREAARLRARLEQRQQEMEQVQRRMQENQTRFEARTEQRHREMEIEIQHSEERSAERVEQLRHETQQQVASVRREVGDLRQHVDKQLDEVRGELDQTRIHLEGQIGQVKKNLEDEVRRRQQKEKNQGDQAQATLDWIESHRANIGSLDNLGLTVEHIRTDQSLVRLREMLRSGNREMALPLSETALANYQTMHIEVERRIGVMEGVADHIVEAAGKLEKIVGDEQFRLIFKEEAGRFTMAIGWLRDRAQEWRDKHRWTAFEIERDAMVGAANKLLTHAAELQALVPTMVNRLKDREKLLETVGRTAASMYGAVDEFETGYANENDVKSPRLVRAKIGRAHVDTYLDLDGTYRVDGYGFESHGECSQAHQRMEQALAREWHVGESQLDTQNRQTPQIAPASPAESWRQVSSDVERVTDSIKPQPK